MVPKTFFAFVAAASIASSHAGPVAISTWGHMSSATARAFSLLQDGSSAVDAVEKGCNVCEEDLHACGASVGFGGHPDANGETTLDAMIMDGTSMDVGSVAGLRGVKKAISVARRVLENTEHTILSGDLATQFAVQLGFEEEDLTSDDSRRDHENWVAGDCQPNYWTNVEGKDTCGPYTPMQHYVTAATEETTIRSLIDYNNHDTIAMAAIDSNGNIAAGASTNGANHKIPGRVGDSPIPGSGSYAVSGVGACGATGDGDVMVRFSPCFTAVELMRLGLSPKEAADTAMQRICAKYPSFTGAIFTLDADGNHAGSGYNWNFSYSVQSEDSEEPEIVDVTPIKCGESQRYHIKSSGQLPVAL